MSTLYAILSRQIKSNDRASYGHEELLGPASDLIVTPLRACISSLRCTCEAPFALHGPTRPDAATVQADALAKVARPGHHQQMRRAPLLTALAVSLLASPALASAQEPATRPTPVTSTEPEPAPTPASASALATDPDADSTAPAASPSDAAARSPSPTPVTPVSVPATSTPSSPAPTAATAPRSSAGDAKPSEISPPLPRLQLAAGFVFGPHALGEADCQSDGDFLECQHRGNFLGAGATVELRAQLFKLLYLHARGVVVGNVRKRPYAVHSGLAGGGLGLGAYSRLAFIRGEYMVIPAFGPDTYVPPFYQQQSSRDRYDVHAGMISGGVHKYVSPRVALELWAGFIIGPKARRTTISSDLNETRVLKTFMVSLGLTFDALLAKGYVPPTKLPRKRRVW